MPVDSQDNGPQTQSTQQAPQTPAPAAPIGSGGSFGFGAAIGAAGAIGISMVIGLGTLGAFMAGGAIMAGIGVASPPLGVIAGAAAGVGIFGASCYGSYKAVRTVYNKVRENDRLDKTWTLAGAVAGAIGISVISGLISGPPDANATEQPQAMTAPATETSTLAEKSWNAPALNASFEIATAANENRPATITVRPQARAQALRLTA